MFPSTVAPSWCRGWAHGISLFVNSCCWLRRDSVSGRVCELCARWACTLLLCFDRAKSKLTLFRAAPSVYYGRRVALLFF
ncbi:hypothetical protein NL676_003349 [Syzygium grande]|nr:hypothetical protein NL676_003349 [Syzygium grande]